MVRCSSSFVVVRRCSLLYSVCGCWMSVVRVFFGLFLFSSLFVVVACCLCRLLFDVYWCLLVVVCCFGVACCLLFVVGCLSLFVVRGSLLVVRCSLLCVSVC